MLYSIYNTSTGKITRVLECPETMIDVQLQPSEASLAGDSNDALQYIPDPLNPVISDKPANPTLVDKLAVIADSSDFIELTFVPLGSTISVGSQVVISTDITVHITFSEVKETVVSVELFPYLPVTFTVQAI